MFSLESAEHVTAEVEMVEEHSPGPSTASPDVQPLGSPTDGEQDPEEKPEHLELEGRSDST